MQPCQRAYLIASEGKTPQSQLMRCLQFLVPLSRTVVIIYGNKVMLATPKLSTGVSDSTAAKGPLCITRPKPVIESAEMPAPNPTLEMNEPPARGPPLGVECDALTRDGCRSNRTGSRRHPTTRWTTHQLVTGQSGDSD